jgi:hypothetical protein
VDINVLESVAAVCAVIAIVQHLGLCSGMPQPPDPAHVPAFNADANGTALPSTSAAPDAPCAPAHKKPPHPVLPPHCRLVHIHVWTDSSSCLSWMTSHRAHYPIIAFVLQVLAHVQTLSGTVVTMGHIPGVRNDLADAPSRSFDCPSGARVRALMPDSRRQPISRGWLSGIAQRAMKPYSSTSHLAREALISLAGLIG